MEQESLQWIGVVDTAVKIGLGTFISAMGGWFIAKANQKHEIRKELIKRRESLIEEIAGSFENQHAIFEGIVVRYSANGSINLKAIGDALWEIHELEGKMQLLGGQNVIALMRSYRLLVVELNNTIHFSPAQEDMKRANSLGESLIRQRDLIQGELGRLWDMTEIPRR